MIKSLPKVTENIDRMYRLVSYNELGEITKISAKVADERTDSSSAWFDKDDIFPFLSGEKMLSQYVVTRTSSPLQVQITKKKVELSGRTTDNNFHRINTCNDPDIVLSLENNSIRVRATKKLLKEVDDIDTNNNVTINGKSNHEFYVTLLGNPNFVLEKIEVPLNVILSGDVYEHETMYSENEISVYARKYFNEYSME